MMRSGCLIILLAYAFAPACYAGQDNQPEQPPGSPGKAAGAGGAKSLDEQLLDELDRDLLPGLDQAPTKQPAGEAPPAKSKGGQPGSDRGNSPLDEKLLQQLGQGEDIELGGQADPLTRIGQRMKTVQELIGQRNTSGKTQKLQEQIVGDLAALIRSIKRQKRKSGSPKGGLPTPQRKIKQPDRKPGQGAKKVNQRGTASTERVGQEDAARPDLDQLRELIKNQWGHLPKQFRDRMLPASDERFLPKYVKLIEDYFTRLAEDLP